MLLVVVVPRGILTLVTNRMFSFSLKAGERRELVCIGIGIDIRMFIEYHY